MRRDSEEDDLELTIDTPAPKPAGRQQGLPLPGPRLEFGRPVDGTGRRRAPAPKREPANEDHVADYRHADASRLNAPSAGLAVQDTSPTETVVYTHAGRETPPLDPHLDPQLVWAGIAVKVIDFRGNEAIRVLELQT